MDEVDRLINDVLHPIKPVETHAFALLIRMLKWAKLEATDIHYISNGITGMIHFDDGRDYEVKITPKELL